MRHLAAAFCMAILAGPIAAQETHDLTVGTYVTERHGMSQWLEAWAADLEERSGGRLSFEILHGSQMGPPPRYYDIARNGQADITWVLHGATPGRFELTEISNMPFLFCSAEQATRVLNDARLRDRHLNEEHRGVRVLTLFMHPPGQINMAEGQVMAVEDLRGKAMRPASSAVGSLIAALGGQPVGLPPTAMAEGLQKGTIDGVFIDFGGAGLAFQLGPYLSSVTEVGAYSSSFGLVMNEDSYADLPDDLRAMINESVAGREAEIGQVWDGLDTVGRGVLTEAGVEIAEMPPEELARMREIGDGVTEAYVEGLDAAGRPGSEVLALMRQIAEEVGPVGPGCQ